MANNQISPSQVRAALALLNWENRDLATAAGVSIDTVINIKSDKHEPQERIRYKVKAAFESAGIEFLPDDGLKRTARDNETFIGKQRFWDFEAFMLDYLRKNGGEVCVSAVNETVFREYRKDFESYRSTMKGLVESGKITRFRVLATISSFTSTWCEYRWQEARITAQIAFYVFGPYLALISFDNDPAPYVLLIKGGPFADAYRKDFEHSWAAGTEPPK